MTPKLTFSGTVKSERIKLTSLLSFRLTLAITVLAGIGLAFLGGMAMTSMFSAMEMDPATLPTEELESYLLNVATSASPFLALIIGVLGVFAISSEYSSGMILSSLAAVPKRTPLYFAKLLVLALVTCLTALLLMIVGIGVAVLYVPESASSISSPVVITGVLGSIAYLVLTALMGFGVAAALRSTAGGIAIVAGVTFVLPIAFQILMMSDWKWAATAFNYLPMSLGSVLSAGAVDVPSGPTYAISLLAMVIWAAIPVVAGLALLKSRDAK